MVDAVELVKISPANAVDVWAFHGPINVRHVADALVTIGSQMTGAGITIHIMSGTHGYCGGQIGAVATREERFADEDRSLVAPKTKDNKPIAVAVHDFNTNKLPAPDYVSAAMAKLNGDMRALVESTPGTNVFVLAYCCSAGQK